MLATQNVDVKSRVILSLPFFLFGHMIKEVMEVLGKKIFPKRRRQIIQKGGFMEPLLSNFTYLCRGAKLALQSAEITL